MTFQETATEYLGDTIIRNKKKNIISLSQKGSILKFLDLFPPKSFTKISCSPFLRTTIIKKDC